MKPLAVLAALASLSFAASHAQAALLTPPSPSDGYRVSVVTMGSGDELVTMFGHDALLVERAGLPPLVYNFGMYTEAAVAPHHILGGTLRYFLAVDHLGDVLATYRDEDRSVSLQVLSLDAATAERLADALSENSLPGHTDYAYDFARDNCTTRVRDALDKALGGALRRQLRGTAALTYRDHALRFTADDFPLYFLFDLGLGRSVDRPLGAWDDAYLPDRLAADLRAARITDGNGTHPLVAREITLYSSPRPPAREKPPIRAPWHALAGFAFGGLLFALGRSAGRPARMAFGLACALFGALVGVLGLWLILLAETNVHATSHGNFNLLVCPAWALALVPAGILAALERPMGLHWLRRFASQNAVLSAAGLVLATVFGQQSFRVALLVLPPLTGAWLGARVAQGATRASPRAAV